MKLIPEGRQTKQFKFLSYNIENNFYQRLKETPGKEILPADKGNATVVNSDGR